MDIAQIMPMLQMEAMRRNGGMGGVSPTGALAVPNPGSVMSSFGAPGGGFGGQAGMPRPDYNAILQQHMMAQNAQRQAMMAQQLQQARAGALGAANPRLGMNGPMAFGAGNQQMGPPQGQPRPPQAPTRPADQAMLPMQQMRSGVAPY